MPHHCSKKARIVSGLLVLFAGFAALPALAQTDWGLQNRIKRMENEIQTLSRAIYRGEAPPPGALSGGGANSADTEVRLQQIETEMRDLRGVLEQQSYETRQLQNKLDRVTSDLELRMNDLEGGRRPTSSTMNNLPVNGGGARYTAGGLNTSSSNSGDGYQWSSDTGGAPGNNSGGQLGSYVESAGGAARGDGPTAIYDNAFSLVKNRQYEHAQREFEVFLADYPNHALAGNAKYWLGETHYVRGNFQDAARIFAEGYKKYPTGSKAADNLLKLGLSLDALGKQEDACIALRQLKKENPAGAAPVLRRADQEMSRLSC